ncbi:MAG: hypothetical protein ABII22_06590 [Candidatus Micrarchaeota archaeon]
MEILKIPRDRIRALQQAKKEIQNTCKIKLNIVEGEVTVEGDVADVYFAKDVVKAVARGFHPKVALKIYTKDFQFYLINLKEHAKSDKAITLIKSRVIGEDGKIKREIEDSTDSYLSIYGNTIGIVAKIDTVEYVKEAIEIIINGSKFSTLLRFLAEAKEKIFINRIAPNRVN